MTISKNLSIKDWAADDRPREKLLNKGISSLSDAELIAILIGSGTKEESAVDVAKRVLKSAGNNLNLLGKLTVNDLKKNKGIGEAKAVTIIAALEIGKRRKLSEILHKEKITSSKDVYELFHPTLCDLPHEEFWILLLNQSNKIIESVKISQGGITGTVTDVRIILHECITKRATSVILCHNHPSGNIQPSEQDILITKKLKNAGELVDVKVIDHIIVTDHSYYSFADEGMI
ncbi:MAG: DNA repair protein RadC [Bacteroidota bacterium]